MSALYPASDLDAIKIIMAPIFKTFNAPRLIWSEIGTRTGGPIKSNKVHKYSIDKVSLDGILRALTLPDATQKSQIAVSLEESDVILSRFRWMIEQTPEDAAVNFDKSKATPRIIRALFRLFEDLNFQGLAGITKGIKTLAVDNPLGAYPADAPSFVAILKAEGEAIAETEEGGRLTYVLPTGFDTGMPAVGDQSALAYINANLTVPGMDTRVVVTSQLKRLGEVDPYLVRGDWVPTFGGISPALVEQKLGQGELEESKYLFGFDSLCYKPETAEAIQHLTFTH